MQQFIDSIRQSIRDENWFSALFMALAIPDICGKLDPNIPSGRTGERYREWANKYLCPKYHQKLDENVFFALRNSCLHAGTHIETVLGARLLLVTPQESPFHDSDITLFSGESYVHLRIDVFCEDVCLAIEQWLKDIAGDQSVQQAMDALLHLTGDPSRAHKLIMGDVCYKWGQYSARGLYSDLPQRKGFAPLWLKGGRIPDGVVEMLGTDAEEIVRRMLAYQTARRDMIQNEPDDYVRMRIGELEASLKDVKPSTPSDPNNISMYDKLSNLKREYKDPDERKDRMNKDLKETESYVQGLREQLCELSGSK